MKQALNRLSKSTLPRYIFVGGVSYVVEIIILILLFRFFGVDSTVSVAISFWFGLAVSFFLQKFVAFSNRTNKSRTVAQAFFYMALVGVNYIFTLIFVELTTAALGLIAARTIALIITTMWNYLIYKHVLFIVKNP